MAWAAARQRLSARIVRRVSDSARSVITPLAAIGLVCLMAASIGVPAIVRPVLASSSAAPTSETITGSASTVPLTLGALPHHSLLQLEAFYAPLAMYLSEHLQRSVRFGTSSSYARFEARLERRDFDIVFIDSLDYVRRARPAGYTALVRRTAPTVVIFIVAAESPLRSLGDLRGATIAMPPDVAPEAQLGRERLRAVGLDPARDVTVHYLPHHNACIQHVAAGRAAACVTTTDALSFVGAEAGKDYRVLEQAGTILPALFAVAPSLSPVERDRLATALIAWPGQSEREGGPANLEWFALEPATDAEFESLRRSLPQPAERGVNSGPASDDGSGNHTGGPPEGGSGGER